jgi:hypothetical protein
MTYRRLLTTSGFGLAAMFAPGLLTTASADVAHMDDFNLTGVSLTGTPFSYDDMFSLNQTLAGGPPPGTVLPSGVNFSDGSPGRYIVIGTLKETGNKAVLDTAQGALVAQPPPFFGAIKLNDIDLLTGPPPNPFSLTQNDAFTTTGLFDLTVPSTPGGLYQLELSDRVRSNMGKGEVLSMAVHNCIAGVEVCGSLRGPYILLVDANFATNTSVALGDAPLDTSNQQILLELTHPTAGDPTVFGYYAYLNGGVEGPLQPLGFADDLFSSLNYTQAGFLQLAPVPEPSSLTLLASSIPGILGLGWFRRRKAGGRRSGIETQS